MEKSEEPIQEKEKEVDEKLPHCTSAPSAEHARANNEDEPCDDSTAGDTGKD